MGYPANNEGYICLNPSNGRIIISRDVRFFEHDYSLNKLLSDNESSTKLPTSEYLSTSLISVSHGH